MNSLWSQLEQFTVNKSSEPLSFLERLSRENGWTYEHAKAVFQEYLKFIYLAVVCERQVTPSEDVDQVWHLHLCYSDSYWNDLCGGILGRKLHHNPTKGGPTEAHRFHQQYAYSLELYRSVFGDPPENIWPTIEERFSAKNKFVRVNLNEVFVLPKKVLYGIIGFLFLGGVLTGCQKAIEDSVNVSLADVFVFGGAILFVLLIVWILFKGGSGKGGGGSWYGCGGFGGDSGCSGGGCGGGCGS